MLLAIIAAAATFSPHGAPSKSEACVPQPLPPAIDSAGDLPLSSESIEFAAAPTLDYPGRAWVVRLTRRGDVETKLEIIRLRRQSDCNRYEVENRWSAPLQQQQYLMLAQRIVPLGLPTARTFIPSPDQSSPEIALDGTGLDLRLRTHDWRLERAMNHYGGPTAARISAVFHDIVSQYIPAPERPAPDWRARSSAE